MATYEHKRFYTGQPGDVGTVLAEVPSGKIWVITDIDIQNTDSVERNVWIYLTPDATSGAGNTMLYSNLVGPRGRGGHDAWEGHQVLETPREIRGIQDVATAITLHISGIEVTP
jgi:hypothetical protein